MNAILKILGWKCRCNKTSRIFKDKDGFYLRCLECGRRIAHNWQDLMDATEPVTEVGPIDAADALQRSVRYSMLTSPW